MRIAPPSSVSSCGTFPRQFEFVTTQLDAMQQSGVPLGVVGSVLMVWAAMGVFGAITSAVNHAWGVDKQPSYFKHKLISFIMLVTASLLLLFGLLLVSAINVAEAALVCRRLHTRAGAAGAPELRACSGRAPSSSS